MKRFVVFLGLALLIAVTSTGCETTTSVDDDTRQSFTVVNSASSTFRIVSGQAGPSGSLLGYIHFNGDGLHKGQSQSFGVGDDDCDKDWKVIVYYNDPASTACTQTKRVPCGGSAAFVFNNTLCSR